MYVVTVRNTGAPSTPQEIKRLRGENLELCLKMGQPVVLRHMWNEDDEEGGTAQRCPACFNDVYDQVRNDCPVCYGFGWASVEESPNLLLWIDTSGQLVRTASPGTGWVRAPRYGGFGAPSLTWLMEPDVAVDVFRIAAPGTLVRTYEAVGVAPWFPRLGDNDLCVNVDLAPNDYEIVGTGDRFQLKMVQQITMRGLGKRGRLKNQTGQAFLVSQSFQMAKAPDNSSLYDVPVDPDVFYVDDLATVVGDAVISGVEEFVDA